ncbi:MAG: TIGR01777 family oxidoreductase [Candidatus Acidiferrales bacterium]
MQRVSTQPLRIVLPGGSGQVGTIVARRFHAKGHDVVVIARTAAPAPWRVVPWNGETLGPWTEAIDNADLVINLAGRSVNCRYNQPNRRAIKESRTRTTRLIGEAIIRSSHPPRIWMNASTATIYRDAYDRVMDEATGEIGGNEANAPSTWRFSIDVATSWEEAFFSSSSPGTRKIALRSAMVMSPDPDGIFDTLLRLVRFRLGGASGSGKQFVSWIHDQDFLRSIDYLIAHEDLDGAINIASPNPVPNAEFMSDLRKAWGTRIGLPASAWMLEIGAVFLRTETELILKSRRVVPGRLLAHGFQFNFPEWGVAAHDLVQRRRERMYTSAA